MAVTQKMIDIARMFEAASIEAGNDFAKATYEAQSWATDEKPSLRIFCVDGNDKSDLWKEGADDAEG